MSIGCRMGAAGRNGLWGTFLLATFWERSATNSDLSQSHQPHGSQLFHDLTGTFPLFHHSNHEAINGGMASGGGSCRWLFWERPMTNSAIHMKTPATLVTGSSQKYRRQELTPEGRSPIRLANHGWHSEMVE